MLLSSDCRGIMNLLIDVGNNIRKDNCICIALRIQVGEDKLIE